MGVVVVAALQDPRKDVLSFRDLFTTRIALRLVEDEQVSIVLGDGARDRGAVCDRIPKHTPGVGYVLLDGDREPTRVRAAYVDDADIAAMVTDHAPRRGGPAARPQRIFDGRRRRCRLMSAAAVEEPGEPCPACGVTGWHLERFAQPGDSGLVFVGPQGKALRRSNFRRVWTKATSTAGLSGVHFHDLRHTGNTLAAASGASLRELMERMGIRAPEPLLSTSTRPVTEIER